MAENFKELEIEPERYEFAYKDFTFTYTKHKGKKTGPLIILIGGWTSAPGYWNRNLSYFLKHSDVIILDLLGHYPATIDPSLGQLDFEAFLEAQSAAVLHVSGKKKPILVGHSTGGLAVLGITALHPNRISKTIAIAPVVYGPVVGLFKTAVLMHRFRVGFIFELGFTATQTSVKFLEQGFLRGVQNTKKFKNLVGMHSYLENYFPYFKQLSGRNMHLMLEMIDRTDLRPLMKDYNSPTLLVRSLVDPIVPSFSSDHLAKEFPCIKEVLFNQCGHFVHLEEQEEFEKVVTKFLTKT
ncbi:MAG: alpha/beta hydrolase [Leptospiraceae bacterium]|nr:alpha/beta hydrolase [Leptospiraceae bacterium]